MYLKVRILGDWDSGGEVKVALAFTNTYNRVLLHCVTVGGKVTTFQIDLTQSNILSQKYQFQLAGKKNYTIYPIVSVNQKFFVTSDDGRVDVMNYDGSIPVVSRPKL